MVLEHQSEYSSQWAAIGAVAAKIGCQPETLRIWVRQAERNQGLRPGPTTDDKARLKQLEKENRELLSSDTQFHALRRHPDSRTPGRFEVQFRVVPSVASRSLSR
jgi:transposase